VTAGQLSSRQLPAPLGAWARGAGADLFLSALIVLGAVVCFFATTVDYYTESDEKFGVKQLLVLAGGLATIAVGASLQVARGARTWAEVGRFALIAIQIAIIGRVIRLYEIEARVFFEVVTNLILFGFIAHHFITPSLRPPLFFFLGVSVIVMAIGLADPTAAALLIAFALGLVAIANLPLSLRWRVPMLFTAAAGLAALHVGFVESNWARLVVPLLASMFMFRMIVYLYDVHNGRGPKDWWARLGYFFLPPNPIFPFFPVVDFATFGRSYYNAEALTIYQRGAGWILRGVIHLLIYRLVYHYLVITPGSVSTPSEFLAFIVTNFALYLRISGLFHLIVGVLLLFGYNLHETHSRFYFANSFIDFWRRINIYWKDFMQKIVFNPTFSRLKKMGAPHMASVLGAIAVVFVATWALHAYQWFWMRGSFLFTWPDLLFWVLLGCFLIVQTYLEEKRPKLAPAGARPLLGPQAFLVLRTACTFLTICLLWSFWTSHSLASWLELLGESGVMPVLRADSARTLADWAVTAASAALALFMLLVTLGVTFGLGSPASQAKRQAITRPPARPMREAALVAAGALALLAPHLFPERFSIEAQLVVERIASNRLNTQDQVALTRGYYEDLTNTNRFNSPLWETLMFRPVRGQVPPDQPGFRMRPDYMRVDFRPNTVVEGYGRSAQINRWGMRDEDYALEKPPGVVRIAIVEASRAAGLGVEQDDLFEARLEERLNAEHGAPGRRYEVLNFSVHGHFPLQRLMLLEERVLQFQPDVVVYFGGFREDSSIHIARQYRAGVPAPYPIVDSVIERAGLRRSMSQTRMEALLAPYKYDVLADVYARFAEASRQAGATPVWFYLPALDGIDATNAADRAEQVRLARAGGFVLLEMERVYEGRDVSELRLNVGDYGHPNAFGHSLIAEALYNQLVAASQAIGLDLEAPSDDAQVQRNGAQRR